MFTKKSILLRGGNWIGCHREEQAAARRCEGEVTACPSAVSDIVVHLRKLWTTPFCTNTSGMLQGTCMTQQDSRVTYTEFEGRSLWLL
ncbi:unnamed protein product [Victoria cruziana]